MRVFITSGGTREPIDKVRSICNFSTGTTGASIATTFFHHGWQVDYCHSLRGEVPIEKVTKYPYDTYEDLWNLVEERLGSQNYSVVIHLAAVSDFFVDGVTTKDGKRLSLDKKIESDHETLHIILKRRKKILSLIKEKSSHSYLVAFKLTQDIEGNGIAKAVQKLFKGSHPDLVVHNDLSLIDIKKKLHPATIYSPQGPLCSTETKNELASQLLILCNQRLKKQGNSRVHERNDL